MGRTKSCKNVIRTIYYCEGPDEILIRPASILKTKYVFENAFG